MSFPVDNSGRVDQSTYWMYFGANMILAPVLLFGGLYLVITGEIALGIVSILLLLPMGIYFRVIMMRRCRDIGWPAFLPWVLLGGGVVINMFGGGHRIGASAAEAISSLATPLIFYLIDFAFMIVIGCIAGRTNYGSVFDDDDRPVRPAQRVGPSAYGAPGDPFSPVPARVEAPRPAARMTGEREAGDVDFDRIDAVIAQRLAALQAGGSNPQPAQAFPQGPAGGFGRKLV